LGGVRVNTENKEALFHYSTKVPRGQRGCVLVMISIMVFALFLLFGSAIYFFMNVGSVEAGSTFGGDITIGVFVTIGGLVVLPFPVVLFIAMMREKSYVEEHLVYDDKIVHKEIFPKENKSTEKILPFDEMDWGLIGNNSRYVPGSGTRYGPRSRYQNEALLFLSFGEKIQILTLTREEELYQWIDLLKARELPVYYLPYNLSGIVAHLDDIDFDGMDKTLWDESEGQRPVFTVTKNKVFENWEPHFKEEVRKKIEEANKPTNGKAKTSLILGIISVFLWILPFIGSIPGVIGLVLGIIGLNEIAKQKQRGKKTAIFGVACSILGILSPFILAIIGIYFL
ncbi:MAG TPA: DUF4190 domain-containing protein, partial [Candidatus Avamphibacillus sp.]|nr:DUF4190 domain-containing protein [Candidatus Avamphibacillus sp.]